MHDLGYEIAPGITVSPAAPKIESSFGSRTVGELRETLNVMAMEPLADFSLLISHRDGADALAAKAWNALWVFHLLALACRRPVMSLYSAADSGTRFMLANRNIVIHRLATVGPALPADLNWATTHFDAFHALLKVERFQHAVRYYGNAHYLFDDDAKIMLLWAGIEGLLGVDAELRRRIALHAAILLDGTADEKAGYFARIKKGYDIRSKGHVLRTHPRLGPAVPAFGVEKATVFTLRRIVAGLQALDVPPPFIVGLTLIGCAPAYYHTREIIFDDGKPPILGSSEVFLPEGQVDGYGGHEVIDAALRPAFDALWNSAGYSKAAWFDANGEWRDPPQGWAL